MEGTQEELRERLNMISQRLDNHISGCRTVWISLFVMVLTALGLILAHWHIV